MLLASSLGSPHGTNSATATRSLIEHMLTDFRDATGKGAATVGSHAPIADVHRFEGVPYVVLPSSG